MFEPSDAGVPARTRGLTCFGRRATLPRGLRVGRHLMDLTVPITGLYAGIQAIIAFVLIAPIGRMRGKLGISMNDGANPALTVAVRRHGNWAEHVPFALLLMALLELNGGNPTLLHGLGIALLIGR